MSKSVDLKNEAIKDYLTGSSLTEVADKYNVVPSTIFVWAKRYKEEHLISIINS